MVNSIFIKNEKSKKYYSKIIWIIKIIILLFLSTLFLWSFFVLKFQGLDKTQLKRQWLSIMVWRYGIWFTDWIITLNFFIDICFLILLILKPKKLGSKYKFWKKFNTVYMVYLFCIYNLTLLTSKNQINDLVNGHIELTSWIDHEITPGCWFIYCILDKNNLSEIKNKKLFIIKMLSDSIKISLFAGSFCLYDATRNYLWYNNLRTVTQWAGPGAYSTINYYTQGWKAFDYEILGGSILFLVSCILNLYWNRNNKYLITSYYLIIIKCYKAIKSDPLIVFKKFLKFSKQIIKNNSW